MMKVTERHFTAPTVDGQHLVILSGYVKLVKRGTLTGDIQTMTGEWT